MSAPVNELVPGRPAIRLRPFVTEYVGYHLAGLAPGAHAGLPSRSLTFIVAFGDPLEITGPTGEADRFQALIAGLHSAPATVRHQGTMHGVELSLTPLGALALLGVPAAAVASTQAHLVDVVPSIGSELVERLSEAPSWSARWVVLDEVLARAVDDTASISEPLSAAWAMLTESDGSARIDDVASEVGWSRRTLGQRFRSEYGLTPKLTARVMRFERAQRLLRSPMRPDLASVAAACGYADQAHMTRDWNEFAGSSPRSWLAAEGVTILQDPDDDDTHR